jgi:hypothetical protein
MILPPLLTGPRFEEGDLVSFTFDDCELTYRTPVVQHNSETLDNVSQIRDFRNIKTSDWHHMDGIATFDLSFQNWDFEYDIGRHDILHCCACVRIIKHDDDEINNQHCLNFTEFKSFLLSQIKRELDKTRFPNRPDWPSKENDFFIKELVRPVYNGIEVELDTNGSGDHPSMHGYFVLNKSFLVEIHISINPIYYEGIDYPYSPEFLRQFKKDLFDDFLSHVKIEYSGETLKTIQQKNKHT